MRGGGGARPTAPIVDNIMISIVFLELGGDGGARLTAQIIENIMISIVFLEWRLDIHGYPHNISKDIHAYL